jgi:putative hydrolase of the HAD superfamily
MVPIFDLDDTLYPERSFVESGFLTVARALEKRYDWPSIHSMNQMRTTLETEGRGQVFNRLLQSHGIFTKKIIQYCVDIYRHHQPDIQLNQSANQLLTHLKNQAYLVTDGHKIVQQNKVNALHLDRRFKKIFITHRYGVQHAKPSIHCFDLIRRLEKCTWHDMFYVGDNPSKDFVNLTPLGVHTIRVMTGEHANVIAQPGYDAKYKINSLDALPSLLKEIQK